METYHGEKALLSGRRRQIQTTWAISAGSQPRNWATKAYWVDSVQMVRFLSELGEPFL